MNVVYILRCGDGTLYTGWTNDLEKRLRTHAAGKGAKYTRARLPVTLVYTEVFETEHEARSRECRIKRLGRSQKLSLIKEKENAEHEKNGA
ncbi:MAG: GIY-YIG nuclease family protein [Oscillospiraceae bacterium]|nr:GIY-YIG nuclease family protein [Oscillospiraceae bacterium]